MKRRDFLSFVAGAAAWPVAASAQQVDYPNRTVRIVIGFGAGGGTDTVARIVAQKLQEALGGTFLVENKPGASGRLAPDTVAKSAPDGYTLLGAAPGAMTVGTAIWDRIPYDIFKDFTPISLMADYPLIVLVNTRRIPLPNWSHGSRPIRTKPIMRRHRRSSRCRSSTSRSRLARRLRQFPIAAAVNRSPAC
jgi:tripartite-type tricarboxylate transporter receptor subunit TctC